MSLSLLSSTGVACDRVERVTRSLNSLANALHLVGNDALSRQLLDLCDELDLSAREVRDAVSSEITTQSRQAEQSSRNVVEAVLAGRQLGTVPPETPHLGA